MFIARGQSYKFANRFFSSATFQVSREFKGHKLDSLPSTSVTSTKEEMLEYYRTLSYYRRFEVVAATLYSQRLIRGFCHLYDGQEAIIAGMEAALNDTDSIITAYRDHDYALARGDSGDVVYAELMGKRTGSSGGKGGSMHFYNRKNNFYGGNGIVGAQVPLGVGIAFTHKYKNDGGVCVAAYGDGAANQGQIFEAANMASLWKLPVIFLCENNTFGMGTSAERAAANTQFYTRGDYVPGLWIDGMDVLACKEGFEFAANYARNNGPIFVEAHTYRYKGHSMSDPGTSYRTRDEVKNVRKSADCIDQTKNRILENDWATEAELKAIDKEIRKQVDQEVEKAKADEFPDNEELYDNITTPPPPHIRRVKTALDFLQ